MTQATTPTKEEAKEQLETVEDAEEFVAENEVVLEKELEHKTDKNKMQKQYYFHSDKDTSEIYAVCIIYNNDEAVKHDVAGIEWTIDA